MKALSVLVVLLQLLAGSPNAFATREASNDDKPTVTRYDHSKLVGYIVVDDKGNPVCGRTAKGDTGGLQPCDAKTTQTAEAQLPKGATAQPQVAALPVVLAGAAVVCFAGGAISGSALLEQNQAMKTLKVVTSKGIDIAAGSALWISMGNFLKYSVVGEAVVGQGGAVAFGTTVAAITAATIAVCAGSAYGGRKTYYFFTRNPSDIQKPRS